MRFVPAMLRSMNASASMIGILGTTRDLCDALLAYPGGKLSDRWGPTRTLRVVGAISIAGYAFTAMAPTPWLVVLATVLTMAWPSMGIVATFDVVARRKKDAMRAFALQAALRRVPMVVGPLLGAVLVARYGTTLGTRAAMAVASVLAVVAVLGFVKGLDAGAPSTSRPIALFATLRAMHPRAKVLLAADVLVRFCEGLPDVFIVVYVLEQSRLSAQAFGAMVALRSLVSIACYAPGLRLALATHREVVVVIGFLAYAAFPILLATATSGWGVAAAFVIAGLREIGEPARKSLLADLAGAGAVGDTLGTYLLVRGVLVSMAGYVGGQLYTLSPTLPFRTAAWVGLAGAVAYVVGLAFTRGLPRSDDSTPEIRS